MEMADKGIQIPDVWKRLSKSRKIALVVLFVALVGGIILFAYMGTREDYIPLFAGLSLDDAGEIIGLLKEKGVPYRLQDNGSVIEVPKTRVYETRIELAAQGMPRGGTAGFELLKDTPLGATDFERKTRYYMALQGELVRTIKAMEAIEDARIHIVVPEDSVFIRERRSATASVLLKLKRGSALKEPQVRAIANLVASGVEGLSWQDVTIIDVDGNDLSLTIDQKEDALIGTSGLKMQLELRENYEKRLEDKVRSMLERVYGPGSVVVRISADMDFDHMESAREIFTPIQNPDGTQGGIRSEEVLEEVRMEPENIAGGVPGTTSNIPIYPAMVDESGREEYRKMESVRNYELSREEQRYISSPGKVTRLTTSAWIDGDLSDVERSLVQETIASAIGFDHNRGDAITVASGRFDTSLRQAFALPEGIAAADEKEWWKNPVILGMGATIVLLLIVLALYRRASRRTRAEMEMMKESMAEVAEQETAATVSPIEEDLEANQLRDELIRLVDEQPAEVAQLIRAWLSEK